MSNSFLEGNQRNVRKAKEMKEIVVDKELPIMAFKLRNFAFNQSWKLHRVWPAVFSCDVAMVLH